MKEADRKAILAVKIYLRLLYEDSEVTSGEFIHSVVIPNPFSDRNTEITQNQATKGIQAFLDWDESDETFRVEKHDDGWHIKYPVDVLEYNGKEYPYRVFHVQHPTEGWEGTYMISTEKLLDDLNIESDDCRDEATSLDESIYHYVETSVLYLPAKEICEEHLDMPFKLIDEVTF